MQETATPAPPLSDPSGVSDAVRVQILATEHWSLLATRGMIWNEMFSRAGMYLNVLSAATVALALIAQATDFGGDFRVFALLVLSVVVILGLGTQIRLGDARREDVFLVVGMNRLRHAYVEVAPDLAPYFVTGHHDDGPGVMQTYSPELLTYGSDFRVSPAHYLAGTPSVVGVINALVASVLAALLVETLGGATVVFVGVGVTVGLGYTVAQVAVTLRQIARVRRVHQPRFPQPAADEA